MSDQQQHIDEVFREKIDHSAFSYDPVLWEALEGRLPASPTKGIVWWRWWLAGSLFLSVLGIAGLLGEFNRPNAAISPPGIPQDSLAQAISATIDSSKALASIGSAFD